MSTIEILWESDAALAVNKPAGIPTQSPQGIESLETTLAKQLDRQQSYLSFPHRLDRAVSGVILVALTKKAARLLSAQFSSRKTQKHYVALVEGHLKLHDAPSSSAEPSKGAIQWDDFIEKIDGTARAQRCDEQTAGAKLASTIIGPVQYDAEQNFTRVELNPITGRMHQLRVQTSARGYPIVGDKLYGAAKRHSQGASTGNEDACGGDDNHSDRIMLHAHRLGFNDPTSGRRLEVTAQCPF